MEIEHTKNSIKLHVVNARLPNTEYKPYYLNQLKEFASYFDSDKIMSIHFGKQDIRGSYSITLIFTNHCANGLKYFGSMKELISFVEGYNTSKDNYGFKQYLI